MPISVQFRYLLKLRVPRKKIVGNSRQSTCWPRAVIENGNRLQGQKNRYVFQEKKNGIL